MGVNDGSIISRSRRRNRIIINNGRRGRINRRIRRSRIGLEGEGMAQGLSGGVDICLEASFPLTLVGL